MPINSPDVFNVIGDAVVTGSGGGAVESVTGTAPISVSPTTGTVVVSLNTTGVVSHDTQPTLSADLDLNANAIVANNNVNGAKLEFFGNNVILSSATVGSIWNAYTASNLLAIGQPTSWGGAQGVISTDKLKIKSANSTSAIKVDNASNTEVFNLEMDGAGSIELNMPDGQIASKGLRLGASGTTYKFPESVGDAGDVLSVNTGGTQLEFGAPTATKILVTAKNKSGGPLSKGTPVHAITPVSSGQIVEVIAARADTPSAMPATLVLDEDLADEAEGDAIVTGFIKNVDTSLFTAGDVLYVGSTGGYTNVKPTGTDLIQNLGIVVKSDASAGSGIVYGSGRSNDVPNIPQNYIWLGNASGVATPTDLSTVAVTSVTGGDGVTASPTTGDVVLGETDTGVSAGTYTNATITVNAKGKVFSASSGLAPVTSVGATAPILSSGGTTPTISLADLTPDPSGTYAYPIITIDSKGRVLSVLTQTPVTQISTYAPLSANNSTGSVLLTLDDVSPDPSGAYTNPAIIVDSKGRVTAATSTIAVSNVTATSPIFSSGGTTPNITHGDSGVTADTYKKATITVNAKGHVTNATPGTDLITMRGETVTSWNARKTWFVSQDWEAGIAKDTGLTTVTLSSFDDWIRYPVINFNEQFDGKIEVEGYLLLGAGVPATKASYRISVWSATGTTGDTSETFTKVIESGNLTAGASNALTVVPKTTLTYTASAGDYLMIGLTNISATIALSTGMCYANLNVRFQNS
jgi:hypothetical protein